MQKNKRENLYTLLSHCRLFHVLSPSPSLYLSPYLSFSFFLTLVCFTRSFAMASSTNWKVRRLRLTRGIPFVFQDILSSLSPPRTTSAVLSARGNSHRKRKRKENKKKKGEKMGNVLHFPIVLYLLCFYYFFVFNW